MLSNDTLRDRRYCNTTRLKPLASQSKTNRILIGNTVVAWKSSPWQKLFRSGDGFGGNLDIRAQDHMLSIYENGEPIGIAEFRTFLSNSNASFDEFIEAADEVSSELYEFASSLNEILTGLIGFCELRRGMRVIEFKRLAMHQRHAAGSKWIAPINAFIDQKFQNTETAWNMALVLCPFPLEFEVGIDDTDLDHCSEGWSGNCWDFHFHNTLLPIKSRLVYSLFVNEFRAIKRSN